MAQAEIKKKLSVSKDKLFSAITSYEKYPEFVDGVKKVQVDRKGPGVTHVTYHVSMIKDVVYTLEHREDLAKGRVEWSLVGSEFMKKNQGAWQLAAAGDAACDVNYNVEVDFAFPAPGFIVNQLVKGSLPKMLENFEKQAKKS